MSVLYIARSSETAARLLGDEMIIMSVRDSMLFTLNPVATVIWQAADGSTPLWEIVERRVCAEFDIEPGPAYHDAVAFVEQVARHGILLLSDRPLPSKPPESSWAN